MLDVHKTAVSAGHSDSDMAYTRWETLRVGLECGDSQINIRDSQDLLVLNCRKSQLKFRIHKIPKDACLDSVV